MRRIVLTGALAAIAAGLLWCARDYNPFEDPSNALVEVIGGSFDAHDTIAIFTAETLSLIVKVPELIDSFVILAPGNRLTRDSTVVVRYAGSDTVRRGPARFLFSFADTGHDTIEVRTFRSNGDMVSGSIPVYVSSPLRQQPVAGRFGDPLPLVTPGVGDRDAAYVWDFGGGVIVRSMRPDTTAVLVRAGADGQGWLYVTDGYALSPRVPFTCLLNDSTPPIIGFHANRYVVSGDTIKTADSTLFFTVLIRDPIRGAVDSASIDGAPFDFTQDSLYMKVIPRVDTLTSPRPVTIFAMDNLVNRNVTTTTVWLLYDPTVVITAALRLSVLVPAADTTVTRLSTQSLLGVVEDYGSDTLDLVLRFRQNGSTAADSVRVNGRYRAVWSWSTRLTTDTSTIEVVAFTAGGDSLAAVRRTLVYDSLAIDSAPPVILETTIDGREASGEFPVDSARITVIAFDLGSGVDTVTITGAPLSRTGAYVWSGLVALNHTPSGSTYIVSARDKAGYTTLKSLTLLRNSHPVIDRLPRPPLPLPVGYDYRDTLLVSDPDNDPVTISKAASSPVELAQSGNVAVLQWTPTAADTGSHRLRIRLYDGYSPTEVAVDFRVVDSVGLRDSVRFATREDVFPAFLETGNDTMQVRLQLVAQTGTPPFRYGARLLSGAQSLRLDSNEVRWAPTAADTGMQRLLVTVTDTFQTADTLHPRILVVPVNRPFTLTRLDTADTMPDGAVDVSRNGDTDTLRFLIVDPDDQRVETFAAAVRQSGLTRALDVDSTRRFGVVVRSGDLPGGTDTLLVTARDRAGHSDTLAIPVYYGKEPLVPYGPTPADSSQVSDSVLTLTWKCGDPDGGTMTYDVYFGLAPDRVRIASRLTAESFTFGKVYRSGTYCWSVVASDGKTERAGPVWVFSLRRPDHVTFTTREADFGRAYEALRDSVIVALKIAPATGFAPLSFSAALDGSSTKPPIVNSVIRWLPALADTGSRRLTVIVADSVGNSDTLRPDIYIAPPNRPFTLTSSFSGDTTAGGLLDMTSSAEPETLLFHINDPDISLLERYTVTIWQHNTERQATADSVGQITVEIDPWTAAAAYDTVKVTITDRGGHTLSAKEVIYCGSAPAAPSSPGPAVGAVVQDSLVRLSWQASDPDGDPLTYDLYFGATSSPPLVASGLADTGYHFPTAVRDGIWYWRVVARDARHATPGSLWTVTVQATAQRVYMNTTVLSGGAATSSTLTRIPVLVRLDSTSFDFTKAASDGSNIGFRKAGSNVYLPHEIELWSSASKEAAIWVLVDTVLGNNGSQYIELATGTTRSSQPAVVFDTADGFAGVWHLAESAFGTGTSDVYRDATYRAHHGDDYTSSAGKGGVIGYGQAFDGFNDRISLGVTNLGRKAPCITVEAWVRTTSTASEQNLVCFSQGDYTASLCEVDLRSGGDVLVMSRKTLDLSRQDLSVSNAVTAATWYHVVAVVNFVGDSMSLYVNGTLAAAQQRSFGGSPALDLPTTRAEVGSEDNGSGNYLEGNLDEVRVSHVKRSGDWVKFSYLNQKTNSTVVRVERQ